MNVVLTGKDSPNVGLVNVLSYDLLVKKIRDVQKVGYKVIIVVSVNNNNTRYVCTVRYVGYDSHSGVCNRLSKRK